MEVEGKGRASLETAAKKMELEDFIQTTKETLLAGENLQIPEKHSMLNFAFTQHGRVFRTVQPLIVDWYTDVEDLHHTLYFKGTEMLDDLSENPSNVIEESAVEIDVGMKATGCNRALPAVCRRKMQPPSIRFVLRCIVSKTVDTDSRGAVGVGGEKFVWPSSGGRKIVVYSTHWVVNHSLTTPLLLRPRGMDNRLRIAKPNSRTILSCDAVIAGQMAIGIEQMPPAPPDEIVSKNNPQPRYERGNYSPAGHSYVWVCKRDAPTRHV